MSRASAARMLAEELGRSLGEFRRVDGQVEALTTERKRLAAVAHRLQEILRREAGGKATARLMAELGLVEPLAKLPRTPGRAPVAEARVPASKVRPRPEPARLQKGAAVRMLAGLYKDWNGTVRWIKANGSKVTYTVALVGPAGQQARTQVTPRSLGRKWEVVVEAGATAAPAALSVKRGPGRKRQAKPGARPVTRIAKSTPPGDLVLKGATVRLLAGKFQGWTGVVASVQAKGRTVTYAMNLHGPDGTRGRTQVSQASLGRTWERTDAAETVTTPPPAGKVVRRRATEGDTVEVPVVMTAPPPVAGTPEVVAPVPAPDPSLPPGVFPPRTPVKMLVGHYLGFTGVIVSVQVKPGPKPDAIYSILLTGPDGRHARTSVRQASLGRGWVRAG